MNTCAVGMLSTKYCPPDTIGYAEQARISIRPHIRSQTMRNATCAIINCHFFQFKRLTGILLTEMEELINQIALVPRKDSFLVLYKANEKRRSMDRSCLSYSANAHEIYNRRSTNILVLFDQNLVSISHLIITRSFDPIFLALNR